MVYNKAGEWRICHPANYSRIPLSNPIRLAAKYDCNVITAHSHHCAIGKAINGYFTVAEAGGLFDRDKTQYLQRSTTFPVWTNGFSYLTENTIKIVGDGWETDSVG